MYAVVVRVKVSEAEGAEQRLRENVVPRVSQAPGFQAGYWTRLDDSGLSLVVFDSEEHARAGADQVPAAVPEGVTLESIEVRKVVASA